MQALGARAPRSTNHNARRASGMSSAASPTAESHAGWIHSTRLHVFLYSFLLVATPFIMLREYMQEVVGQITAVHVALFGHDLVVVPWAALIVFVVLIVAVRRHLTPLRIVAGLIALGLIALAQQITDYYFHHNFYDIQQNWHYFAYGGFAFMLYRDLVPRGISPQRIILLTFGFALLFSTFDEAFQYWINTRTYDTSDIAKDAWGVVAGMSLLYLGENPTGALLRNVHPVRHRRLRDYFAHPFSTLLVCFLFVLSFLCISSVLSQPEYTLLTYVLTVAAFILLFLILHVSQFRAGQVLLLALLALLILVQGYFYVRHREDGIVHCEDGLVVYRGIPIPLFDVMIRADGSLRIVDRKKYFYARDRQFFIQQEPDILLMGSGMTGSGGRGFPHREVHQFNWNYETDRGMQVIILPNRPACVIFNRLMAEGKNVLFVLHNTE
ncbi:MAG: hypothetical protein GF330_05690 [Candidatus Eisenbacteria bacterium]|nr:hypothetical protein [Candidatus Eisenbacteria bacterium]